MFTPSTSAERNKNNVVLFGCHKCSHLKDTERKLQHVNCLFSECHKCSHLKSALRQKNLNSLLIEFHKCSHPKSALRQTNFNFLLIDFHKCSRLKSAERNKRRQLSLVRVPHMVHISNQRYENKHINRLFFECHTCFTSQVTLRHKNSMLS